MLGGFTQPIQPPRDHGQPGPGTRASLLLVLATLGLRDSLNDLERLCYIEAVEQVACGDYDAADDAIRDAAVYRRAKL